MVYSFLYKMRSINFWQQYATDNRDKREIDPEREWKKRFLSNCFMIPNTQIIKVELINISALLFCFYCSLEKGSEFYAKHREKEDFFIYVGNGTITCVLFVFSYLALFERYNNEASLFPASVFLLFLSLYKTIRVVASNLHTEKLN